MVFGRLDNREFSVAQQLIVLGDQGQVDCDALVYGGLSNAFGHAIPVRFGGDLRADLGEVVLAIGMLDMGQQCSALAHEVCAAPQEVTGGAPLGRIDIGLWEHATAQQGRNFL
jgi:hypothetical protein